MVWTCDEERKGDEDWVKKCMEFIELKAEDWLEDQGHG